MKKTIFVVTHKDYSFPSELAFKAIQVGNGKLTSISNFCVDKSGDNIAHLNSSFCELTALYWIWKNDTSDVTGLMHYRRYFKPLKYSTEVNGKKIASIKDFEKMLESADIIVARPRNYVITTISEHYKKAHYEKDLDLLRAEIQNQHPDYLPAFDHVMAGRKISLYNMFVTRRELVDQYCEWLFGILLALEKKVEYQDYDNYQKRIFGFMAERLFNVWLEHHKNDYKIVYRPVINIEGENLVKKAYGMIKRHFFKGK